ncbi:hypothetical protein KPL74_21315 [Bacillus sp. NP157]|nr:hypothetical protein KPL74_21315 [Bacillus sp. NP157]
MALWRSMDWKMRTALFIGACMLHLMGSIAILGGQTMCTSPPCIDAWAFDAVRAAWLVPVFLLPWAEFPAQEAELVRDWELFGWLALNAATATGGVAGTVWGAVKLRRRWLARRARRTVVGLLAQLRIKAGPPGDPPQR